jgi:hypothetical protein
LDCKAISRPRRCIRFNNRRMKFSQNVDGRIFNRRS